MEKKPRLPRKKKTAPSAFPAPEAEDPALAALRTAAQAGEFEAIPDIPDSSKKPEGGRGGFKRKPSGTPTDRTRLMDALVVVGGKGVGTRVANLEDERKPIEQALEDMRAQSLALATLEDIARNAVRTYYNVFAKKMVQEPDYASRGMASKVLLAYKIGEPVKRQQIIVSQVDSMEDLGKKLAQSPEMCDTLLKIISDARQLHEKNAVPAGGPQK